MKIAYIERADGTTRRCRACSEVALRFGYAADVKGAVNKSSRVPLCLSHAVVGTTIKR